MWFDSGNGWLQFAFGNERDTYCLPGLLMVNYHRYLLYCLRIAGYKFVYFLRSGENDGYRISCLDNASLDRYKKIRPKGILGLLSGAGSQPGDGAMFASDNLTADTAEKIFYKVLKEKEKTALVTPIAVLDSLFPESTLRSEQLLECSRNGEFLGNLLLITCSVRAEDSNAFFVQENGILSGLSEEIRQAAIADGTASLYEKLQENLGNRLRYLNDLSREMLRSIVLRNMLLSERFLPIDQDLLEKLTLLLECYYHSEAFRREVPDLQPDNPRREYRVIDQSLKERKACSRMLVWLQTNASGQTERAFESSLLGHYPRDEKKCWIYTDDFLLQQWDIFCGFVEKKVREDSLNQWQEQQKRLSTVREKLNRIVLQGDMGKRREALFDCLRQMKKSFRMDDKKTFKYGIDGGEYLMVIYGKKEKKYDWENIWEFYQTIFAFSERIQNIDIIQEKRKEDLRQKKREKEQILEKHGDMDIRLWGNLGVSCNQKIEELENLILVYGNRRMEYQKQIEVLENAAREIFMGGNLGAEIHEILQKATDIQLQYLQEDIADQQEMQLLVENGKIKANMYAEEDYQISGNSKKEEYHRMDQELAQL